MAKQKSNYQIIRTIITDDGMGGKEETSCPIGYCYAYSDKQAVVTWCIKNHKQQFSSYGTGCGGSVRTFYTAQAV